MAYLRLKVSGFSALVPMSMLAGWGVALERVAQDPMNNVRVSDDARLKNLSVACVEQLAEYAAMNCPQTCMIAVPDASLPQADSCDPRNWRCAWPVQNVDELVSCPAGWNGQVTQDVTYEIRNCGANLVRTGQVTVTSNTCSRVRTELKTEPCPAGGGWIGVGVLSQRNVHESLANDLTTIRQDFVSPWMVQSIDCRRDVVQTTYQNCSWASCTNSQVNGSTINNSDCGYFVAANSNLTITQNTVGQRLNFDLATITSVSVEATSVLATANCEVTPEESVPSDGNSGGDRVGDGPTDGSGGGGGGEGEGEGDGCPLVLDLEGNGVSTVSLEQSKVVFDWLVDGKKVATAWVAPDEALLAHDANGNGLIDGAKEIFGNRKHQHGFAALAEKDVNLDGYITEKDPIWLELKVWFDRNSDGIGQKDEIKDLKDYKIRAISVVPTKTKIRLNGADILWYSYFVMEDGTRKSVSDVFFDYENMRKRE